MSRRSIFVLVSAVLLLVSVAPAAAEEVVSPAGQGAGRNILLTIKLGQIVDGAPKMVKEYQVVLAENTEGSRLLSGARVPLQTETHGQDDDQVASSFTYQNIGFTVTAEARSMADGRISLRALLEDSRIREEDVTDGPPVVETRQLSVAVVLVDGKPMEITRVEGVEDHPGYVEVQADVLD